MFCTKCGKQLPDEALFCCDCGSPVGQPPIKKERVAAEPSATGRAAETENESPAFEHAAPMSDGEQAYAAPKPFQGPPDGQDSMAVLPPQAQPEPKKKHGVPAWVIALICAAVVLTIVLIVVIASVLGNGEEAQPAATPPYEASASAPETAEQFVPETAEGECFYAGGTSDYSGIGELVLSFVLSADKTSIHDVKITVSDLNTTFDTSTASVTLEMPQMTTSFSGEYAVDYDMGTDGIKLGESTIEYIAFDGEGAYVVLDFIYVHHGFGPGAETTNVPFGYAELYLETQDDVGEAPAAAPAVEEPDPTKTVFDEGLLKNWNDEAMLEAFGTDIYGFTPEAPEPMHYIVCADKVIDPETGAESAGGYGNSYSRHLPISTDDLLEFSGKLWEGGLTLTDDPDKASYALILHYSYTNNEGTFRFSEDNTVIPQYHATLDAELLNLATGERISCARKNSYATYTNESVYTAMLDAAKEAGQLYGGYITLYAKDFEDYWDFVGLPQYAPVQE